MPMTDRSNFFVSLFTRNIGLFITDLLQRFFRIFLVHRFRNEKERDGQRERERESIKKNKNTRKAEK